ncbi:probable membrane-associated kinase regulator 2 isoform X2 [Euphorbia lathyris]|uniref:probable membrane-associated kinase regulator 2 isoform X2 n=1 Tax=Euphorbia lathyris TaxID=212925 RepID=UPI003313987A
MEAFSLLKYWKSSGSGGGGGGGSGVLGSVDSVVNSRATTIVTAVAQRAVETDDDDDDDNDDDDDGPFFDLEFSVPDEEEEEKEETNGEGFEEENGVVESDDEDVEGECEGEGTDEEDESEFKFTVSSGSSNDRVDQNLALSPSDDLFFKGRLVPIEPASLVLNGAEEANLKPNLPVSFMKSATKLRVLMLKFKKSRLNVTEKGAGEKATDQVNESAASPPDGAKQEQQKQEERGEDTSNKQSKFFTVKFKVEEIAKVSLFTRENSKSAHKSQKQSNAEESTVISDEKRFSKDVMQKYLNKVKPLYVRVSKRYGEKLKFSGQLSLASGLKAAVPPPPSTVTATQKSSPSKATTTTAEKSQTETEVTDAPVMSNMKSLKQGNLPAGLRVVCKHLGKSRSASSAVAAAPPAPTTSKRRDDSLLQQQDGIQSAILHCKRSFNASRVSDPSHEKTLELTRKSADDGKVPSL